MAPAKRKNKSTKTLLRSLPSVSTLLEHEEAQQWLHGVSRAAVVRAIQAVIDDQREAILAGEVQETVEVESMLALAEEELWRRCTPSLRGVINATGIVLHTGLGRAPLCESAIEAIAEGAGGYCNLEYDLDEGSRGKRNTHIAELLTTLTGAEAATVVNNNAAATLLILQTFASGREAIVSRGQLIEIGGSFRLPDIMRASGAILREVGTTNRTRLTDYEQAITENTSLLFRAHPSNYRIIGFTEEVAIGPMAELAQRHNLIAVDDMGSGAMFNLTEFGLPEEPTVQDSLSDGADLVCFSGDKLLGGPQCGIILGREDLIQELEANPLMRTYRVDKLTLLALEATLRHLDEEADALKNVPTLAMLTASVEQLASRANALAQELQQALPDEQFMVCSDVAYVGGGAMPARQLETVIVQWRPTTVSASEMAAALRSGDTPVIARIRDDAICFDLRTILDSDTEAMVSSVTDAISEEDESETDDVVDLEDN